MRIVVTGATGFLGGAVAARLAAAGHDVVAPARDVGKTFPPGVRPLAIRPIEDMATADWKPVLEGADAVIHAAALAHIGPEIPPERYNAANRDAAARLAEAAAEMGMRRFVFISSIRAQVGATSPAVQTEASPEEPTEAYGRSKLEAERLIAFAIPSATILRPPLIVGGEPKANLRLVARLAALPFPLPFGALGAPQAVIGRDNLIDAIALALASDALAGRVFVIADEPHPSLADMLRWMREGAGRAPALVKVPEGLLGLPLKLLGRGEAFRRIVGGLRIDGAAIRAAGWVPKRAIDDVFREIGRRRASGG